MAQGETMAVCRSTWRCFHSSPTPESAGEIAPEVDAHASAAAIVAVMDGLQIQWLYAPDSVDMAGVTSAVINALVDPLRPLEKRPADDPASP